MALVFQMRRLVFSEAARKARPKIIDEFYASMANRDAVVFTPQYGYRQFFYPVGRVPSRGDKIKGLLAEQVGLSENILSGFKDTSVVFFVEKPKHVQQLSMALNGTGLSRYLSNSPAAPSRVKFKVGAYVDDMWPQDWGEPTGGANSTYFRSLPYNAMDRRSSDRRSPVRNEDARDLGTGDSITLPVCFQGGNFTKARNAQGRSFAIMGSDDVAFTKNYYQDKFDYQISDAEIKNILKAAFRCDDVLFLGPKEGQLGQIFHIDMGVLFPRDGTAVLLFPEISPSDLEEKGFFSKFLSWCAGIFNGDADPREVYANFRTIERQLSDAGFEIIRLPTSLDHVNDFQAYSNSIPISDGKTHLIIMPSFGDIGRENSIRRLLGEKGFKVEFVPNGTFGQYGNSSCITGAISHLGIKPRKTGNSA